jgi:hypothetical protein
MIQWIGWTRTSLGKVVCPIPLDTLHISYREDWLTCRWFEPFSNVWIPPGLILLTTNLIDESYHINKGQCLRFEDLRPYFCAVFRFVAPTTLLLPLPLFRRLWMCTFSKPSFSPLSSTALRPVSLVPCLRSFSPYLSCSIGLKPKCITVFRPIA